MTNTPMPDTARCLSCSYPLRGLPTDTCPECGRTFDRDDSTTYSAPDAQASWRRPACAPSRKTQLLMVVIALLVVEANSASGHAILMGTIFPCMLTPCILIPASVVGLCVAVGDYLRRLRAIYLDRARTALDSEAPGRSSRAGWTTLPLCVVVIISVFLTDWPLHVRFQMSRSAFERELAVVLRANATATQPVSSSYDRRLGLYGVSRVYYSPGQGVYFTTGGVGFGSFGFIYDTSVPVPIGWQFGLRQPWSTYMWNK